jgi:cyclohexanone monooxygenase
MMMTEKREVDAVVVGAGFGGMYMIHKLRTLGLTVQCYEGGSGAGGTWFWNRYPGARVDIESMEYSFQFSEELQQEWEWSERYAPQSELLQYANHVVDRFDLRQHIQFETRVTEAVYDEEAKRWNVATDDGSLTSAKYCIMATGCLSSTNTPDFPGIDSFEGNIYHTGQWPHEPIDFSNRRVGIIGTGSSAIQSIPLIAEQADHLTVFQRTANYSIPAHNQSLDPDYVKGIKGNYAEFRAANSQNAFAASFAPDDDDLAVEASPETLQQRYQECWDYGGLSFLAAFGDLVMDDAANDTAKAFIREKIAGIVNDPKTAELLMPKQSVGCKRLCVDTGYYATFNRSNVQLVDISEHPIDSVTVKGVTTNDVEYCFDDLIFATGFDAMTGSLLKIDIEGKSGLTLAKKWEAGPRTFLGLGVSGFPNLFTISGPGSPSVLTNMIVSIEQHVRWIGDCINYLEDHNLGAIEATTEAEDAWVEHVNEVAEPTIFPGCNSWYLGANVPGKPRIFMPYLGFPPYVEKCDEVAENGYAGFSLSN